MSYSIGNFIPATDVNGLIAMKNETGAAAPVFIFGRYRKIP
jgi:hypothetical protein